MTGAGDLFSSPQPVTPNPVRALTLGALRVHRAEGVGRDEGSAAGGGFPRRVSKSAWDSPLTGSSYP